MLGLAEFNKIKQTNISKDGEKTKQRVREVWRGIKKPQREEILSLSGLKKFTVERTYKNGNISAKLAAALAQVLSINPYYLTGASDELYGYSDDMLRQFLTENGYGKFFESDEDKKKRTPGNSSDSKENSESIQSEEVSDSSAGDYEEDGMDIQPEIKTEAELPDIITEVEPPNPLYELLMSRIQEKIKALTPAELDKLETMPEEKAVELLKGLHLRSEYVEEARHITVIVKLLMTL